LWDLPLKYSLWQYSPDEYSLQGLWDLPLEYSLWQYSPDEYSLQILWDLPLEYSLWQYSSKVEPKNGGRYSSGEYSPRKYSSSAVMGNFWMLVPRFFEAVTQPYT